MAELVVIAGVVEVLIIGVNIRNFILNLAVCNFTFASDLADMYGLN